MHNNHIFVIHQPQIKVPRFIDVKRGFSRREYDISDFES